MSLAVVSVGVATPQISLRNDTEWCFIRLSTGAVVPMNGRGRFPVDRRRCGEKKGVDLDLIDALNDADGFLEHTTPPAPLPLPICDERVSAAPLRRAS